MGRETGKTKREGEREEEVGSWGRGEREGEREGGRKKGDGREGERKAGRQRKTRREKMGLWSYKQS